MSSYLKDSPFPFYCRNCGLVEANTALGTPICPKCRTTEILQYGKPSVSSVPKDGYTVLQNFDFEAYPEGNLCPKCKGMTLVFSGSLWWGD